MPDPPWAVGEILPAAKHSEHSFYPGDLKPTARAATVAGWLLCDGTDYTEAGQAALFAAIGHTWDTFDGQAAPAAGRFRVPKLNKRALVARDPGGDVDFDAVGDGGGAKTHTLITAEMPAHTHTGTNAGSENTSPNDGANVAAWRGLGGDTGSAGGGGAHNNMPPFAVVNYLIKT